MKIKELIPLSPFLRTLVGPALLLWTLRPLCFISCDSQGLRLSHRLTVDVLGPGQAFPLVRSWFPHALPEACQSKTWWEPGTGESIMC